MQDRFVRLFHGSKSGIRGAIKPMSRELCDFGRGFYMGTEKWQPMALICNYENAILYELELDTADLRIRDIPLDINWALFVAFNRGRLTSDVAPALYEEYAGYKENIDVFKGYIANDRMFVVLDRFFDGDITDVALVKSLSALKLGMQYVAVTQEACDAVSIRAEQRLSAGQKKELILKSEENRRQGGALANDICRIYRREGRYFDELIR